MSTTKATEVNRHTRMKIRGTVASLSLIFLHPPEDKKKKNYSPASVSAKDRKSTACIRMISRASQGHVRVCGCIIL